MKDEKKVKATEEEAKKEVQPEEEGVQLTDEELSSVAAGFELSELDFIRRTELAIEVDK